MNETMNNRSSPNHWIIVSIRLSIINVMAHLRHLFTRLYRWCCCDEHRYHTGGYTGSSSVTSYSVMVGQ